VRIVEEILLIQVRIIRHKPTQKKPTRRKEGQFWLLPCAEKSEAAKRDRREPTKRGPRSIDAHEQEKGTTRVCFRASDRSIERASGLGTITFVVVVVVVVVAVFVVGGGKEAERSFGLSSSDCGFSG
jgi:hypothetical protein